MRKNTEETAPDAYKGLLEKFIETKDEKYLYRAEQVSKSLLRDNILPEEIVDLHNETLTHMFPELPQAMRNSMTFLLETMISYGLAHQEYQSLRDKQLELNSEISLAASMQKTFLRTEKPEVQDLEVGVISVPAHQMNGDYHHFVDGEDHSLGVAIADVVGKGIPAALCMSMIKYSLDSFPNLSISPNMILRNLNRVVERNIDPSMYITMFYGQYLKESNVFRYASAGHEPALFYSKDQDSFSELSAKGLVLGVTPDAEYGQKEVKIDCGDFILLLTDGVTECRQGDDFLETEEVLDVIRLYMHLPAQELVEAVFKHFERLQDFQLRDDFTLVIIRRVV